MTVLAMNSQTGGNEPDENDEPSPESEKPDGENGPRKANNGG